MSFDPISVRGVHEKWNEVSACWKQWKVWNLPVCTASSRGLEWQAHCGRALGSLQGQQGLCWSDGKIGTGVRCEGYKCKHTQRKWVTIPTLLLAHCASPRILKTDAKSWPLGAFGFLNKQMLPWQFLAGFCVDLLFKRAWCRVYMPVTETGFVLGLAVPGRSTLLHPWVEKDPRSTIFLLRKGV